MKRKRKWTPNDIQAAEKQLIKFIHSGQVSGKRECQQCLNASPKTQKRRLERHQTLCT
ncbi:hypothetical protein LDENG_00232220 [Lucifuga dentata]|nr:hypothetical protein LDENG_00232220 [Lucifuga dentata]